LKFRFIDYLLDVPSEMSKDLQEEIKPMMKEEEGHMAGTGFPNSPTFKPIFDLEFILKKPSSLYLNLVFPSYFIRQIRSMALLYP